MLSISPLGSALAVPPATDDAGVEAYLTRILDWHSLMEDGWLSLCCSNRTLQTLFDEGKYPFGPELRALFRRTNERRFGVEDVLRVANDLLTRAASLEETLGIEDVLWNDLRLEPPAREIEPLHAFVSNAEHVIGLLAAAVTLGHAEAESHVVHAGAATSACTNVTARGTAAMIEIASQQKAVCAADTPVTVDESLSVVSQPFETILRLDPAKVWLLATQVPSAAHRAIRLAWMKFRRGSGITIEMRSYPKFTIGSEFLKTARGLGFMTEPGKIERLLRATTEILVDHPSAKAHALREGAGANDAQRSRGNDKAWRQDVDYEFHLHYWYTQNGPEFASIVVHGDFSIP